MRWEEPHHPGPGLQLDRHSTPLLPTLQHNAAKPPPAQAGLHHRSDLVDDGGDLHGYYFRLLLRQPATWALLGAAAICGGAVGIALGGPAIGAVALMGAFFVGLVVVLGVARRRSEDAFFDHYAAQRDMTSESGRARLPGATPLLKKGDDRYAVRVLEGPLGDGCEGLLALFTYEEHSTDSDGHRHTTTHEFTLAMSEVPECIPFVPELYCRRRSGPRALDRLEDAFHGMHRIELESAAMADRYEIFVSEYQDLNWMRQLFSPSFIVWMTESAPERFSLELFGGKLCCYLGGHLKAAEDLDQLRAATSAVAARLREEALE